MNDAVSGGRHDRFTGAIAGVGASNGVRVVVGHWRASPWGPFADVMLAEPDGTRVLLAPDRTVADFVASTYTFDRVEIGPVAVRPDPSGWQVSAPGLNLRIVLGRRRPLGGLLRLVPSAVATAPRWATVTDRVARVALRGVRTRGTAGNGRREYYGPTDLHGVRAIEGSWQGHPLGKLAPVEPDPAFGFGSTPRKPSVTSLVATVVW